MKFKFAYENVMKNKKNGRDVAYRNFAEADADLRQQQNALSGYVEAVAQSRDFNQELAERGVLGRDQLEALKWTQEFLEGQKIKIARQQNVVQDQNLLVEQKIELLSEAAKEFKIFEKLKERMKEKFKKAQKKHELKAMDEMVVMRAYKGRT